MDLTLEEILSASEDAGDAKLKELYKDVETVAIKLREMLKTNIIAVDTYLTFDKGLLEISIGSIFFRGTEVKYVRHFAKKTKRCMWGSGCKAGKRCEYHHEGERRVLNHYYSPTMLDFMECPLEMLAPFYRSHPSIRPEIDDLKLRILDGVMRLLWLSSEGVDI